MALVWDLQHADCLSFCAVPSGVAASHSRTDVQGALSVYCHLSSGEALGVSSGLLICV